MVETLPVDGSQDGFPRTAGWFAVVIESTRQTDAVGPAMMTAAVPAQAVDKCQSGFGRACWRCLREEAALPDFDRVRARSGQRDEWIGHVMEKKETGKLLLFDSLHP
jgi:hypothetical protein